jgi:hypothetical protein
MFGFLADDHLPAVLRLSHLSDNNKGDNAVKPGAVHGSYVIYLRTENPKNLS